MQFGAPILSHGFGGWLRLIILGLLIGPIIVGTGVVFAQVLGHPAAIKRLLEWPGLIPSTTLSLMSGVLATATALTVSLLLVGVGWGSRPFRLLTRFLSPFLSVPHAATAMGLAFLIAPSGWVARLLSPWATGWEVPPDVLIVNDPLAISLMLGLVLKEIPFLLLMSLAALPQTDARRRLLVTQSLGAGQLQGFVVAVLPPLYRQIRLPVYAVLAYSMTTVDMAQILGPTRPPTLSLQIALWTSQGGVNDRLLANAAALWQLGLTVLALMAWYMVERLAKACIKSYARGGIQFGAIAAVTERLLGFITVGLGLFLIATMTLSMLGLGIWSLAGMWRFPDALPQSLSPKIWILGAKDLVGHSVNTLILGLISSGISCVLVVFLLALPSQPRDWNRWIVPMIYLPLLVPQITFLPGLQVAALGLGWGANMPLVIAMHLLFVFPYVYLSLSPAYHAWDVRIARIAESLGGSNLRILFSLRLPMLLRPILTAFAVGFAVSVAQYLPTLMMSGGRIETLTTEAVALSSGGNRRLIGAYGLLQMVLPALVFGIALFVPAIVFANRKGMEERHA